MGRQLDSWRALLPAPLQWLDENRYDFTEAGSATAYRSRAFSSSPIGGGTPTARMFDLAVLVAHLRSSFYYARFLICLPFVYQALHSPDSLTPEDVDYCALAVRNACLWPLSGNPSRNMKYLVPHHFTWTQQFVRILLILRVAHEDNALKRICQERIDADGMETTIFLLLNWIKDMTTIDGLAERSWNILRPLWGEEWLRKAGC